MKSALLTIIFINFGLLANAQSFLGLPPRDEPFFNRGASLYLVLPSFMTSPHSNLSPLLVESGYPLIPKSSFNYGLGLNYRLNRFEPGFDFAVGNQNADNPLLGSELLNRSLTTNLYLNYYLFRWDALMLFPFIGYSATDTNLILSKQSPVDDFGNLLENPGTSVNLQHLSDGMVVGLGVAMGQHWEESTAIFRLKFAYRIPFSSGQAWESRFSNFQRTPMDSFPYFFIQFEMGVLANWKKGDPWMDKVKW